MTQPYGLVGVADHLGDPSPSVEYESWTPRLGRASGEVYMSSSAQHLSLTFGELKLE